MHKNLSAMYTGLIPVGQQIPNLTLAQGSLLTIYNFQQKLGVPDCSSAASGESKEFSYT